jgi:hypothetical protein
VGSNRGCSGITKVDTGHANGFNGPVLITVMVDHTGQGTGSVRVRSRGRVSHAFMHPIVCTELLRVYVFTHVDRAVVHLAPLRFGCLADQRVSAEQGVPETLGPTQGPLCKHASAFSIPKRMFLRQHTYQRLVVQTFIVSRFYLNGSGTAPSLSSCSRSVAHLIIALRTPKVVSRFTCSSRASKTHSIQKQGRLDTTHHPQSRHYNSGSSLLPQDGPSLVSQRLN